MMNNKLPPSYGALYGNRVPLPKNQGYLLPKNEEISEESPSNETIIEMPAPPSQNENQQTQVEIREEILMKIIAFLVVIIFFCFFWWLFTPTSKRIVQNIVIYRGKQILSFCNIVFSFCLLLTSELRISVRYPFCELRCKENR